MVTQTDDKLPVRVLVVPTIATPLNNRYQRAGINLPYLRGLKLAHPVSDDDRFEITLLIGADFYWQFVQDQVIRANGPTVVQSKLGYLLSGPISATSGTVATDYIQTTVTSHIQGDCNIERFWYIGSMGIAGNAEKQNQGKDLLRLFQETGIKFENGQYIAKLPWKSDHPLLPINYNITKRWTESTICHLRQEPDSLKKYGEIILEQEKRGFIERVNKQEIIKGPVHYIPHHAVKKDSATTPIRIVYNCSCRENCDKPSLNDCLQSTPPELNDITSLLVRFRLHGYAVTTDIKKAFLHIGLNERDRDVTRFLWLSDPANPNSPLITNRFQTVLFRATCSPFILNATLQKHLINNQSHVPAASILKRDLYVDNILSSFNNEAELLVYFHKSRDLMSSAKFNLRSWSSNRALLQKMAAEENVLDTDEVTKILGMRWDPKTDILRFTTQKFVTTYHVTKRLILQQTSKIFDPLSLLSPVTVQAKLLIQDLWKMKYDWDTPLPENLQQKWTLLAEDLTKATRTQLSRRYFHGTKNTAQDDIVLHTFVDASMKCYGATAYVCKGSTSALVMEKNQAALLKKITLPRLELMAALVGSHLAHHLQKSISVNSIYFWGDSQIVLYWLQTKKTLKRFVENRVQEKCQLTEGATWRYCPTEDNPADLLTRGIAATQLTSNILWWNGKKWATNKNQWPDWQNTTLASNVHTDGVLALETEATFSHSTSAMPQSHPSTSRLTTSVTYSDTCLSSSCPVTSGCVTSSPETVQEFTHLSKVIDFSRYSSLRKLLRITSYIYRFVKNCRRLWDARQLGTLSAVELKQAENRVIRGCQATSFGVEMASLHSKCSRLPLERQLRLFVDNAGILRCGGRIQHAPVNHETKFPILLPSQHSLTHLIILDSHVNQLHTGVNGTITHIRQRFWIPCIRQRVRSILRKCVTCKKVCGTPYIIPDPPPLPKCRLGDGPPFAVTGVDFTGALFVHQKNGLEKKV